MPIPTIDFYSPGLALAIASLAVAVVAMPVRRYRQGAVFRIAPLLAAVVGLIALALSVASHVVLGHRPGTVAGLGLMDFAIAHPAAVVVAVAGLVLALWSWRS